MTATHKGLATLGATLLLAATPPAALAQEEMSAIYSDMDRFHPVYAEHGMVATQQEAATTIGLCGRNRDTSRAVLPPSVGSAIKGASTSSAR